MPLGLPSGFRLRSFMVDAREKTSVAPCALNIACSSVAFLAVLAPSL